VFLFYVYQLGMGGINFTQGIRRYQISRYQYSQGRGTIQKRDTIHEKIVHNKIISPLRVCKDLFLKLSI